LGEKVVLGETKGYDVMAAWQSPKLLVEVRPLLALQDYRLTFDPCFAIISRMESKSGVNRHEGQPNASTTIAGTVPLSRDDYESIRQTSAQGRKRNNWDLVFTVGQEGTISPFTNYGHTPAVDRTDVTGVSPLLDTIAEICYTNRGPGRFFVNSTGVFYKDRNGGLHQTVRFNIGL
jgi:hypothetical protein